MARHAALQPRVATLHRELDELNGYLEAITIAEAGSPIAADLRAYLARRLRRLLPQLEQAAAAFHAPSGDEAKDGHYKQRRHQHAGLDGCSSEPRCALSVTAVRGDPETSRTHPSCQPRFS